MHIESLESRTLFAATVSVSGSTLSIVGDAAAQTVIIQDESTASAHDTTVSLDANGDGLFTEPGDLNHVVYNGITTFDLNLGKGADKVIINLAGPYEGANKQFFVDGGNGNNAISFTNAIGNTIRNSNVLLNIITGRGADSVTLDLGQFSSSKFTSTINTGDGNDTLLVNGNGFVGNSTVDISADMGAGNDIATNRLDWDMFDLPTASSTWRFNVYGGDGNDTLQAIGELGSSAANVLGLLDIGLYGQGGDDTLTARLDQFNLNGGTLRLREAGGAGSDTISLAGTFATTTGGGSLDLQLLGHGGNDILTSNANTDPALTGSAILDGGRGTNSATAAGTLKTILRNVG
jgi:hypothetical protein